MYQLNRSECNGEWLELMGIAKKERRDRELSKSLLNYQKAPLVQVVVTQWRDFGFPILRFNDERIRGPCAKLQCAIGSTHIYFGRHRQIQSCY